MVENGVKNSSQQMLANIWWLVLLRGLLIFLMGTLLVFRPLPAIMVLIMFLGFYWFLDGLLTISGAIRGKKSHPDWGRSLFAGILSVIAGLIIFSQPFISAVLGATFFIYLIGFMILVSGVWNILTGIRLRKTIVSEWSLILGGILSVVFALILLMNPLFSAMAIVWLIGLLALIGGIFLIIIAFRLKKQI